MEQGDEQQKVLEQLTILNTEVRRQSSLSRMFLIGIVYGVGFFIGSAILATIALGILGPWFAEIPWIRSSFETGASMLH